MPDPQPDLVPGPEPRIDTGPKDPLADLRAHHPQAIDLSRLPDRAFTPEEKQAILRAASEAATWKEWASTIAAIAGKVLGGVP